MRIGIDARLAGSAHGGIGRYTEELLRNVIVSKEHTWVVFLHHKGQLPWLESRKDIEVVYAPIRHYTLQEQLAMPRICHDANLDLLHVPHFNIPLMYQGKLVVTIHDLLWHERRDRNATTLSPMMHMLKYRLYTFVAETAIRRAAKVIVPTEHVKQIVKAFTTEKRIVVTHEGVSDVFTKAVEKVDRPYPYIVYTGSLYPHKNVSYVLSILEQMHELHAVIVSGRSVFQTSFWSEVLKRKLEQRVHIEPSLDDASVASLYGSAIALVFPSFSEGFGLPGLEAMACGCPVLASDIPVFHEVYQDAAMFIDPYDATSAVRELKQLIHEPKIKALYQRKAETLMRLYSWKHMAQQTLQVYESVGAQR